MGPSPPRELCDLDLGGQPSPPAGSMSPSQSASSQCGWGFHTVLGGIDPGDPRFRPRVVGVSCRDVKISNPGMRTYPPWVRRDLEVVPRGNSKTLAARWHEPQPISNQPVGLEFPQHAGRYRPRGISVFVAGLLEL